MSSQSSETTGPADPEFVTCYRVVGWYSNIQPRDRTTATLSDGAIWSSLKLAEEHIRNRGVTVLHIERILRKLGDPEIDHLLRT
jgi:hypothetical protein